MLTGRRQAAVDTRTDIGSITWLICINGHTGVEMHAMLLLVRAPKGLRNEG